MRLARFLLLLTFAIHVVYAALPLPLLATQPSDAAVPAVLAVAPLAGLLWFARRHRYKPHNWPTVSLVAAAVQSAGAMAAIVLYLRPTELHPALNLGMYLALWLPPLLCAWLARRALLATPSAELGRTPYQVRFQTRATQKSFWSTDSVVVTGEALEIELHAVNSAPPPVVGERPKRVPWKTLPLNDITAVGVRASIPNEAPWAVLRNGPSRSVPVGDVVVVQTRTEEQVLPVERARTFVELLHTRTGRALPSEVAEPVAELDTHVAEVLPAPEPTGPKVHATSAPGGPLPTGPGLTVRWLIAVPLALLGIAGVPLFLLLKTSAPFVFAAWIGVAVVVWLLNLRVPRVWGRVAMLPVPVTFMWLAVERQWPLALALLLCPVLGRLAGAVFTNWRGTDLGGSAVEVPFKAISGDLVFLQKDRLVQETRSKVHLPNALWLAEIDLVQSGARVGSEIVMWQLPGGLSNVIGSSPLLRLVAGRQQWILPTKENRLIAALVAKRAETAAPAPADDLDLEGWYRLRAWAVSKTYGSILRFGLRKDGIGWRLFGASIAGSFAWLLLQYQGVLIPGLVCAALAVLLLVNWARLRPKLRRAEHHPLPPGSPGWGETRPDHAPVEGYQPWV
jgi:hypothetical protein